MSYILIPQIVADDSAMIWIGAVNEKVRTASVRLEYIENGAVKPRKHRLFLKPSEWRTWKTRHVLDRAVSRHADVNVIHYQRVTVDNLDPRREYIFNLFVDEDLAYFQNYSRKADAPDNADYLHITEARVTTLPKSLPESDSDDKPFTVLLGSCYYRENDPDGMVGKTFLNIPENERPEIKFLCGDQVYLDNPWMETTLDFVRPFAAPEKMRTSFFMNYLKNWTHVKKDGEREVGGFNLLLRNGANYFCSDDHEFWNNAPSFGIVGFVSTFFRGQKRWWFREAGELFRLFQSLSPWMTFDVPPVSFCIADTRVNRLPGKKQFMEEEDLEAIGKWIRDLKGPGVLVLGQLLMTKKSRWFGFFTDLVLPDYERQYEKLLEYIKGSDHSIVVLTGDVHFGRVAHCDLDPNKGTKFVEVISSPMMVVSNWRNKPEIGDCEEAPEIFGTKVETHIIAEKQNHFATLEFARTVDGEVEMSVKAWSILKPDTGNAPESDEVFKILLN